MKIITTARKIPRRCYVLLKEVTTVPSGAPNLPHKGLNKAFKQAFHKASPPLDMPKRRRPCFDSSIISLTNIRCQYTKPLRFEMNRSGFFCV